MAQPTPYVVTTDFSEEEADGVGGRSTVRTSALDAELANIATTVEQIRTNLGLIQRADGKLIDLSVDTFNLTPAVLTLMGSAGFNLRASWLTATAYAVKDMVKNGTGSYVCIVAHTSGTFATDLAAGKWLVVYDSASFVASGVAFTPAGTISSTNVQDAVAEVATDAAAALAAVSSTVTDNAVFTQAGTGAVARTNQAKMREVQVSVTDFGATGDGVTDDTTNINKAITYVDSLGGGTVFFPPGTYATSTGITLGNGSNSAPSTIHNKVKLVGAGYGSSSGVINQQVNGASRILYTGSTSATAAPLTLAGPMYGVGVEDLTLDCAAKAGRGLIVNHVTMSTFRRLSARNYTTIGYDLTTRTGNPTGCAFGCGDNRFYDCYGWLDDASLSAATILGVKLNSGVSTAVSLAGQPDSARNLFIGGTFMYGTTATSYGLWLSGADNNAFYGSFPYPYGGSTSGKSIYFNQWAASGNFPLENAFYNVAAPHGIDGNGSVGSGWGNVFYPLPTSDASGALPTISGVSGVDHTGKTFVAGVRAYRQRQSSSATLNNSVQSNSTTSAANIPGLSVTLTTLASSKLRISFSGRASKSTAGLGFFIIALGGSAQGETRTDVNADTVWHPVSAEALIAVGAGAQVVTVQFTSSNTDAVQISHGSLVVEEFY